MKQVLLDTHAWTWSLNDDPRLSAAARATMEAAEDVFVSAISLFEIGQKVRLGKWPEMEPFAANLVEIADRQGARFIELSPEICLHSSLLDWDHRDPFDRIIGATALKKGLPLVSADTAFDALSEAAEWRGRIW